MRIDEQVGQKYDLSRASFDRYIRIDSIIDGLKIRLDNTEIDKREGVLCLRKLKI